MVKKNNVFFTQSTKTALTLFCSAYMTLSCTATNPTTLLSANPKTSTTIEQKTKDSIDSVKETPTTKKTTIEQARPAAHRGRRRAKKMLTAAKKKRKTIKDMSYEELKELKGRLLAEKNIDTTIKCLEKMVAQCKDAAELKLCMLELADLLFEEGKLSTAERMYTEFAKLYPGSPKIEDVLYKAILCAQHTMLDAKRDQTKTHETITLTQRFLEREEIFTAYAPEVRKIQQRCYARLFESEESIASFYLKRGSKRDIVAAQNRIQEMHKEFVPLVPEAEARVLALECSLAEKQHDAERLIKKQQELSTILARQEQKQETAIAAALEKPKARFANRF